MSSPLPKGDAAAARLIAKNTEAVVINLAVEMNELKKRIRALELDSHPPINLKPAIVMVLKELGVLK